MPANADPLGVQPNPLDRALELIDHELLDDALALLRALLVDEPQNQEARYLEAICLEEQGAYEAALGSLEQLLGADPGHSPGWFYKCRCLFHLERFQEARDGLALLARREVGDPELEAGIWYYLIWSDLQLGCFESAEELWSQARGRGLDVGDVFTEAAREFHEAGDVERALRCCAEALGADVQDGVAWLEKGVLLQGLGRGEHAKSCFEQSLGSEPINWHEWQQRGDLLHELGRAGEALEAYERSLAENPWEFGTMRAGAATLVKKGGCLERAGRCGDAVAAYEEALRIYEADDPVAQELRERLSRLS